MKKKSFFNIKRIHICGFLNTYTKYYLIMLERIMYLPIILLLVQYRFQNQWFDGKHNAKVRTVNWQQFNRQQVNINVYVRCFPIIIVQKNIFFFFATLIYLWTDLYFWCDCFLYLSVINFTPTIRVLVIETQSLVILICIW